MSPQAVLVGVPGAGKTSVGRELAALLGVNFVDTDELIEIKAGKPVSDIFIQDGEEVFRGIEAEVVQTVVANERGVVSLGGGSVVDETSREAIHGLPVVWLRVTTETAIKRTGLGNPRPMLLGGVRTQLKHLMEERAPYYEEVAIITIDTDDQTAEASAAQAAAELEAYRAES